MQKSPENAEKNLSVTNHPTDIACTRIDYAQFYTPVKRNGLAFPFPWVGFSIHPFFTILILGIILLRSSTAQSAQNGKVDFITCRFSCNRRESKGK